MTFSNKANKISQQPTKFKTNDFLQIVLLLLPASCVSLWIYSHLLSALWCSFGIKERT